MVIAGTHSGVGKTSLTLGLVASLKRRGFRVQTFKVGPDFLDPSYLATASGRPCYNLDGWMTSKEYVLELFDRTTRDADIAVIEGVMGLFDGAHPVTSEGSTGEIARWLEAPVLLVVNAHGMGRSLAALAKGYVEMEPDVRIAGIIANHIGSDRHRLSIAQSLESTFLPPLIGAIPRGILPSLPSRHLGLVTADSRTLSPIILDGMAGAVEKHLSMDALIRTAKDSPSLSVREDHFSPIPCRKRFPVGVAFDEAFHFYYPDNLEALEARGCDLIRFSPLRDRKLPAGLTGLYFGGGYPEEYAEDLESNESMRESVRNFASRGTRPVYAECGGLMYLSQGIETHDGRSHSMVGLLPVRSRMFDRLRSLGYVEVTLREKSLWGAEGAKLRGHEFHYSELTGNPLSQGDWKPVYQIARRHSQGQAVEGFQRGEILASYIHLHWASRPHAMETFMARLGANSGPEGETTLA